MMVLHDALGDRQPQAAASRRNSMSSVEFFEDVQYLIGRNALPFVGNSHSDLGIGCRSRNRQMPRSVRIPNGVVQNIFQHLADGDSIRHHCWKWRGNVDVNLEALLLEISIEAVECVFQ